MSLPQNVIIARHYRILFAVPTVLSLNFLRPRGNYRGYSGIAAFPVTVSSRNAPTQGMA